MELRYDKEKNFQQRIEFIHQYAAWVKKVPNKLWSTQQASFLNSLFSNSKQPLLSAETYLKIVDKAHQKRKKKS